MARTVDEQVFYNITLKGEHGHAEVQRVTRLVDTATGESVAPVAYHRHVIAPDDDDSGEPVEVQRARATFVDAAMLSRWEAARLRDLT